MCGTLGVAGCADQGVEPALHVGTDDFRHPEATEPGQQSVLYRVTVALTGRRFPVPFLTLQEVCDKVLEKRSSILSVSRSFDDIPGFSPYLVCGNFFGGAENDVPVPAVSLCMYTVLALALKVRGV